MGYELCLFAFEVDTSPIRELPGMLKMSSEGWKACPWEGDSHGLQG